VGTTWGVVDISHGPDCVVRSVRPIWRRQANPSCYICGDGEESESNCARIQHMRGGISCLTWINTFLVSGRSSPHRMFSWAWNKLPRTIFSQQPFRAGTPHASRTCFRQYCQVSPRKPNHTPPGGQRHFRVHLERVLQQTKPRGCIACCPWGYIHDDVAASIPALDPVQKFDYGWGGRRRGVQAQRIPFYHA